MQIIVEIPKDMWEKIQEGYVPLGISKYLKNGTILEDILKDFLEWYTLPFNDNLFKHTDEVIQEFMDFQRESTDADSD